MLLKIFWNFWNSSRKKSTQKQPFSGVYKIDVLKKFANFTKKFQCWSHFLKKSPEIKRLQRRCFPVNFAKLLRTSFLQSTSGGVGVCLLKFFTFRSSTNSYVIVWSFSRLIAKTICTISISCFWYRLFSTLSSCIWKEVNLHVVETKWETKKFHKNFHKVLERGIRVEIKRHYILPWANRVTSGS